MKKYTVLLILFSLFALFCACNNSAADDATPTPNAIATPTQVSTPTVTNTPTPNPTSTPTPTPYPFIWPNDIPTPTDILKDNYEEIKQPTEKSTAAAQSFLDAFLAFVENGDTPDPSVSSFLNYAFCNSDKLFEEQYDVIFQYYDAYIKYYILYGGRDFFDEQKEYTIYFDELREFYKNQLFLNHLPSITFHLSNVSYTDFAKGLYSSSQYASLPYDIKSDSFTVNGVSRPSFDIHTVKTKLGSTPIITDNTLDLNCVFSYTAGGISWLDGYNITLVFDDFGNWYVFKFLRHCA